MNILELNNLQGYVCYKIQTKSYILNIHMYKEYLAIK